MMPSSMMPSAQSHAAPRPSDARIQSEAELRAWLRETTATSISLHVVRTIYLHEPLVFTAPLKITIWGDAGMALVANGKNRVLQVHGASVWLKGLQIAGGAADVGGCICVDNGGILEFSEARMENCTAHGAGGGIIARGHSSAVFIRDATLTNLHASGPVVESYDNKVSGGGIAVDQGQLMVVNSVFMGLRASSEASIASGGAVAIGSASVQIRDSIFSDIKVFATSQQANGGAISVTASTSASLLLMTNCTFRNVSTRSIMGNAYGGAIIMENFAFANVSTTHIFDASAIGYNGAGGAILMATQSKLDMHNSLIEGATAYSSSVGSDASSPSQASGGAIHFNGRELSLSSTTIKKALSHSLSGLAFGGGIAAFSGEISIENGFITDARAVGASGAGGGALYASVPVLMKDTTITLAWATTHGSALQLMLSEKVSRLDSVIVLESSSSDAVSTIHLGAGIRLVATLLAIKQQGTRNSTCGSLISSSADQSTDEESAVVLRGFSVDLPGCAKLTPLLNGVRMLGECAAGKSIATASSPSWVPRVCGDHADCSLSAVCNSTTSGECSQLYSPVCSCKGHAPLASPLSPYLSGCALNSTGTIAITLLVLFAVLFVFALCCFCARRHAARRHFEAIVHRLSTQLKQNGGEVPLDAHVDDLGSCSHEAADAEGEALGAQGSRRTSFSTLWRRMRKKRMARTRKEATLLESVRKQAVATEMMTKEIAGVVAAANATAEGAATVAAEASGAAESALARQGVRPERYSPIKRASVQIAVLNRDTGRILQLGSGTMIDGGEGTRRNQVLTAAHLFIETEPTDRRESMIAVTVPPGATPGKSLTLQRADETTFQVTVPDGYWPGSTFTARPPNPYYLRPCWVRLGLPEAIDWSDPASPIILAIGMFETNEQPSHWRYWAELTTPLAALAALREAPNVDRATGTHLKTQLLDLAVLRIRGRLELAPASYTGFHTAYKVTSQAAADDALAERNTALPLGVPLGAPEALETGEHVITVFGWYSEHGTETTFHSPQPKVLLSKPKGLLVTEALLETAGSGGATCDHAGRIVAVNSFTGNGKTYLRMVSCLEDAHGLELHE